MLLRNNTHENKDMTIMIVILLIVALMLFDLLVRQWSVDSTDNIESAEWERRHT